MTTTLLVTVDTEEDDAWSGFRATGNTVQNVAGWDRFQELCDRYGVQPTYLVDESVIDDEAAADLLSTYEREGRAEIGAHLHPWCSPPFEEEINHKNSYLCNLPESLQRAKLVHLTDRITAVFGHRPTSFRAGRYGIDHVGVGILAELGYIVDSSVIPFTDYSGEHGPNFKSAPHLPYFPSRDNLSKPAASGDILEVPVGVGFSRSNFAKAQRWRDLAAAPGLKQLRAVGILDRIGIARRIKLSPEQSDVFEMRALIDALRAQHAPCAVLMLHSSSLVEGMSPYVRLRDDLERLFDRLDGVFHYCRNDCGMPTATLSRFAEQFRLNLHEQTATATAIS